MESPLHHTLDPGLVAGEELETRCACGAEHPLATRRCPRCRARNPYPKLLARRRRLERWLDDQIRERVIPDLRRADLLRQAARQYLAQFCRALEELFLERRGGEDLDGFLRRLGPHFSALLKDTAPRTQALKLAEILERAGAAMAGAAFAGGRAVLKTASAGAEGLLPADGQGPQAERISRDLAEVAAGWAEALRTLQLTHSRLGAAVEEARPIFARGYQVSLGKAVWNRARSLLHPVGKRVRFETAVWKDDAELSAIRRLDQEICRLERLDGWLEEQVERLEQRSEAVLASYRISLRRFLLWCLARRAAALTGEERRRLVHRLRSLPGVGGLWFRLFGKPDRIP